MDQYLKVTIAANPELHEILIAELSRLNYDSFQEKEYELEAFIQDDHFSEVLLKRILTKHNTPGVYNVEKLENINWNEQWEKNFDPVDVEGRVLIRASFHLPQPGFEYEIIINPKMSFGTGHHETTYLMISEQLQINHKARRFLDVGTGTGILAVMAHNLGAKTIKATDTDEWSIANSMENFQLNSVSNVEILQGTIDNLTLKDTFDIICANINKNVLLVEIPFYAKLLATNGILLLSGFYEEDMEDLIQKAAQCNLYCHYTRSRNSWALIRLSQSIL